MPFSFKRQKLGLSKDDVKDDSVKARAANEARLVSFNGKMLGPTEVDLLALSDELQQSLSPAAATGCVTSMHLVG
jgi:hypothetical protein